MTVRGERVLSMAALALAASIAGGGTGDRASVAAPFSDAGSSQSRAGDAAREGRWTAAPVLPTPRTEVAAAVLGGRMYVVGGFGRDGRATALVEAFEFATGRWTAVAPLPASRHHVGAAALGSRLYVVGGYDARWRPVADVVAYDPAADRWTRVAPLPTARGALAVAVVGGRLHALGGVGDTRANTGAHDAFDPATGTWAARAPLPTPRDHLAVGALPGRRLVAAGGRLGGSYSRNLTTTDVYDVAGDRWRPAAPLLAARSGVAGATLGPRFVLLGGESPAGTYADAFAYDPEADIWAALTPMPTARHGLAAVVHEGRLHAVGGGPTPGLSVTGAHEVLELP